MPLYLCQNKTKKKMKKQLTTLQKETIKKIKKEATKAINKLYATTFDNELRNKRYFEIKAIEENSINEIINN